MMKMLQRLIGENVRLEIVPGADLWPVHVDPSQIDQILASLCTNARDAISGTGTLRIETGNCTYDEASSASLPDGVPGEYVRLAVTDDGCGMDGETLAHIFEPFFTGKAIGKATGLGLATVHGIVKQNGGFVAVRSTPGEGTTFAIHLPRHGDKPSSMRGSRAAPFAAPGQETILLVEDEPSVLKLVTRVLEHSGYHVIQASTPGEAIRLARERRGEIQLLLTDLVMPDMNGQELSSVLSAFCPNLKHVFMSGYTADIIAEQGIVRDAADFIQKPFSPPDLVAKVRDVLDRKPPS
jgi:CheY-like chemotaxis protein